MEIAKPESVGISSERLQRLSCWLQEQISSERLAGASVMFVRHSKVVFFEAAGLAEIETQKPFTEYTIVRIFSMTKPITTVAAMMLFEADCFQLDDPISRYLPEFKTMWV